MNFETRTLTLGNMHPASWANPNEMSPDEMAMLQSAIKERGFLQHILVRGPRKDGSYEIIDGHHRAEAAKALGMAVIPCTIVDADDATAKALSLGMNRLRGQVNLQTAGQMLAEFQAAGWGDEQMALTGFSEVEWRDLVAAVQPVAQDQVLEDGAASLETEDEAPEPALSLELKFTSRDDLKKVKKALRKAAGPTKDMAVGLLRLLEIDA